MLITETVTINERQFVKNYSDSGFYIERDGVKYSEAHDPIEFKDERTYTETNELIPTPEPEPVDPERINRLEQTVEQQSDDIEANAEAIQELAEIIGGE